ncbi:MAG: ABC transporter ATP-binding protein [Deltaproteobacteria bacterium]|nr:ABC transporter ATP-binding protein [Deltaproteobacteria bacterium]
MSDAPIVVEALVKRFAENAKPALDGAQFRVRAGHSACLLGPNGAGKTTLIRILTGALAPTSGHALLFGARSGDPRWETHRRRVGVVPQLPGMYRDLTAREYLALVQGVYGRGDVAESAKRLGFTRKLLAQKMAELSGGWQRRLTLAAALLPDPELIVLDEPTVGLDPVAARDVLALLREAMKGRTTLLCTHNLAEAEQLCDMVVVLREGRVILDESLTSLRTKAASRVTLGCNEGAEKLLAFVHAEAPNLRTESLRWSDAVVTAPTIVGEHVKLSMHHPRELLPVLLGAMVSHGLSVYECTAGAPTLEDLFIAAVGEGATTP